MLDQIKKSAYSVSSNSTLKFAVQVIFLALILIAALAQPEAALAGPSWGGVGG